MPFTIPSTAWSSGASSKMMFAALPPSSSVRCFPVPASSRWIALPTSVEPVNAILSTPSCLTSAAPVEPSPVTMLTTPGGSSAWRTTSQKRSAVSGVVSARLLDRLAAVEGLEHGKLARALLHDARDPEEVLRPLRRRRPRPLAVQGFARRADREPDVLRAGLRDLRERLLACRANRRE